MNSPYRTSLLAWYVAFAKAKGHVSDDAWDSFSVFYELASEGATNTLLTLHPDRVLICDAFYAWKEARERVVSNLINGPAHAVAFR